MWLSVMAVSAGAVIGANLRWLLSLWLNNQYHPVPYGTLTANLIGAWLIGVFIGYFTHQSALSPEWRLFVITGLCGALTTFSTFSLEMLTAIQQGRWSAALVGIGLHVVGSLIMTALGLLTFHWLRT